MNHPSLQERVAALSHALTYLINQVPTREDAEGMGYPLLALAEEEWTQREALIAETLQVIHGVVPKHRVHHTVYAISLGAIHAETIQTAEAMFPALLAAYVGLLHESGEAAMSIALKYEHILLRLSNFKLAVEVLDEVAPVPRDFLLTMLGDGEDDDGGPNPDDES